MTAGLDNIWPLLRDCFARFLTRSDDGNVAGFVIVMIVIGGNYELPAVRLFLSLLSTFQEPPALGGSVFGSQPIILRIGE